MKISSRSPIIPLLGVILVVYLMRQSEFSPSRSLTRSFRTLVESRPSGGFCSGVDLKKASSAADVSQSSMYTKGLTTLRKGNKFQQIFVDQGGSGSAVDYGKTLIPVGIAWGLFLGISVFICLGNLCNWCCIYGCFKCCCSGCTCCKQPKDEAKKMKFMAMAGGALMTIFSTSLTGVILSSKLSTSVKMTYCSVVDLVQDTQYNSVSEFHWLGVLDIAESLDTLISNFDNAVQNLSNVSSSFTVLDTKKQSLDTAIDNLYENNKGRTATRGDPSQTSSYQPDYIANLGPQDQSKTNTYFIQTEVDGGYNAVTQAAPIINDAVNNLKTNNASIKAALEAGKAAVLLASGNVNNLLTQLTGYESYANTATNAGAKGIAGLFGFYMVLAVLAMGAMTMTTRMKIRFCNKILHLSWCLIGLITFWTWTLSAVLYIVGITSSEVCGVATLALGNQTVMNNALRNLPEDMKDVRGILNTCIFGDGNIMSQYNLSSQIGVFNDLFSNLVAVENKFALNATSAPSSVTIPPQQTAVSAYLSGTSSDSDFTTTDLSSLNNIVNGDSNGCTDIHDTWTLASSTCTAKMGTSFTSTNVDTFNLPSATCLGYDQWMTGSHNINNRYTSTQFPSTCSSSKDLTTSRNFVNTFVTNRNNIQTVFNYVQTDLNNVNTKYQDYATELFNVLQSFKKMKSTVQGIRDSLIGAKDGLIGNTNCNFVKDDLNNVLNAVCVGFVTRMFQGTVMLTIVAFSLMSATLAVFCLAKRLNLPQQVKPYAKSF